MRAAVLNAFNGIESVEIADDIERPVPTDDQLLIRVQAAGVNPSDYKTTEGMMRGLSLPYVMGHDFAGEVIEVGGQVTAFNVGDQVLGNCGFEGGSFAEFAAVNADRCAVRPSSVEVITAAALPVVGLTAWQAVHTLGQVSSVSRVLIHAGAGGVGSLAVQLAKRAGAHVITTASETSADAARKFGADEIINYREQRFEDVIGDDRCDFVFDTVGGETTERSISVLKPDGLAVSIVSPDVTDFAAAAAKRGRFLVIDYIGSQLAEMCKLISDGELAVRVARELPLADAKEALSLLKDQKANGKLVLLVD